MAAAEKAPAPRVLLCGDVEGRLHQLCKRVTAVNKSNGPFDCLLCVGQFFPSPSPSPSPSPTPSPPLEIKEYIAGSLSLPLPTFFIGDYGEGSKEVLEEALLTSLSEREKEGEENEGKDSKVVGIPICQNLQWLRGSGVVEINGLQVGYLGGRMTSPTLNEGERKGKREEVDRLVDRAAGVGVLDVLLTNEWPMGVLSTADKSSLPAVSNPRTVGSTLVAELAKETKPRYHVAGSEGVFYAREPYMNPGVTHVTRFVGLAAVGNDKKQKFLHALSPTPASLLSPDELAVPVPGSSPSPYEDVPAGPSLWPGSTHTPSLSLPPTEKPLPLPEWAKKVQMEEKGEEGQFWRYSGPPPKRKREGEGGSCEERVCFEFRSKGTCSRGEACRYKHVERKEGEGDGVGEREGESLPKGVCFDFVRKGSCERGDECRYRHSSLEEERTNQGLLGSVPKGVCFDFVRKGKCERGEECRFLHSTPSSTSSPSPLPPSISPSPCWFCLSSPSVESHLIASVANQSYVALPKGPLVSGHALIVPIEHYPNIVGLPSDVTAEVDTYRKALEAMYRREGKRGVAFERYMRLRAGTHAHVQVVPVPEEKMDRVEEVFQEAAQKLGFTLQLIGPDRSALSLSDSIKKMSLGGNYFSVETPAGNCLMYGITAGDKFPLQFGREVMAEVLGLPERADWKNCKLTKEEETKLVEQFKEKFQEFDIM